MAKRSGGPKRPRIKTRGRLRRLLVRFAALAGLALAGLGVYLWLTLPDVSTLRTGNPASTSLMRLRETQARTAGRAYRLRQEWVPFDRIPRLLGTAVRVAEDASFYDHQGIDVHELWESLKRNLDEGRAARGGSTITQQLAKNLYLSTEKTLWRKLREVLIARRLERALPKNRIFSLYLNVIELGPGVFGVQAAARHWFGRDVGALDLDQIVRLTAIIPRPLRADPRGDGAWLKARRRWILDTLLAVKAIDEPAHRAAAAGL